MKTITLKEFKKLKYNPSGISNYKLIDCKCSKCGLIFEYSNIKKFLRNRINNTNKKQWSYCQKCYLRAKTADSPEWLEKNKQAQLIAQNRPEQKIKNAKGVSRSWTQERKRSASEFLKNRIKNDLEFRAKVFNNIEWTNKNSEKAFYENLKKSLGTGGLRGVYKSMYYDSALELSFILWCESVNLKIKRYDLEPVKYIENGKNRLYFPDFIINQNDVIEIKGYGLYYKKNYEKNLLKEKAARNIFEKYEIIFSKDYRVKSFYNQARKLHHEIKK